MSRHKYKFVGKFKEEKPFDFGLDPDTMTADDFLQLMFYEAIEARQNAQAPYSKFAVGATVRSAESGRTYAGCNVERCSYSQTTHAEQNAIDSMVAAEGAVKIEKIVLVGAPLDLLVPVRFHSIAHHSDPEVAGAKVDCRCDKELVWPCFYCRQIIWENCLGDNRVPVYTLSRSGNIFMVRTGILCPMPFGPEDLGINYKHWNKMENDGGEDD